MGLKKHGTGEIVGTEKDDQTQKTGAKDDWTEQDDQDLEEESAR